ncbi:WbuC family cupin fold metalloprotein [Parabacteroides sp. AM08-6]|uniref:WbuC family cupin fold metalloprotein n=1 Tax=Parabacteroides sp. AM08-6 TaxID=2292053 RepID=UPI000EFE56E6|nr:WbuC family cupin fold metalloprotein [Parabacteroides sp. AM08-6]RHJ83985.1 cupin fold metalloprotein, WbuC family [Parabacteroides sp. AM08-6]
MKTINKQLLDATTERAKQSPRLRMNYNFHEQLDDPINRLLNAMEPGTYLRPHRHSNPDKEEIFLLLRGKVAVFIFDNDGNITEKLILNPKEGTYGAEIKAGTWHGLLVLESGSVIYEIKQGPFAPLTPDNLAPWSPVAEDTESVGSYMIWLEEQVNSLSEQGQ